jgi:enoyl-CoA hydratase/carnithine racemase
MGAAFLLPRIVGQARATEILMLGEKIPAAHAKEIGLANGVVPLDDVLTHARNLASKLASGAALAIRMTKRMLNHEWTLDIGAAIEAEAQAQALLIQGRDHKEFYAAWKEKRPPMFTGE